MADVNAPSPYIRWIPIEKTNCYLDLEKSQSNPILCFSNLSSNIPSIYIQQFWDTLLYDKKAGCYKCQLDEQWFDLTKETLREALQITPVNRNQAFPVPSLIDGLIDFVNQLGYPKMPIPSKLITANIREAPYYQEYQVNVAKHRGFLAGETRSTQDLPAPKPAKPARKPQSTAQKAPLKHSISSPVTSTQPAPTSATGTTDKPAKAKRIKRSASRKTHQPRSSPKSVGESKAEEVPTEELQVADEDTDFQKAMEESMKDAYALPKGPLPQWSSGNLIQGDQSYGSIHIPKASLRPTASSFHDESPYEVLGQSDSEEESEKIVLGVEKGSPDEGQAGPDPNAEAEGQTGSDTGAQAEGQAGSNPDETSEGQAGPDPSNTEARVQFTSSPVVHAGSDREHMDLDVANVSPQPSTEQLYEGFTATVYPNVQENLKLTVEELVLLEEPASSSGTLSSLQHISRDFSFGDQFFSDKPLDADKSADAKVESMLNVPIQQALSSISLMTSPSIDLTSRPGSPKEHQQLKATTTDTTTTTTTTLPPPQAPQQSTTEAMMVKRIGELEHTLADLIQVNKTIKERLDKHGARLYTLEQLDIPQQVIIAVSEVVTDAVDLAMQVPLRNRFRDLPEADMKEILYQRVWESDSYKSHEDHMQLFEVLEKSINRDQSEELAHDLVEAQNKRKKGRESPKTPPGSPSHHPPPPPPPPPAGPSGTSGAPRAFGSQVTPPPPPPISTNQDSLSKGSGAPSPIKTTATTKHQAWSTPDVTLKPLVSLTPKDLDMDEAMKERPTTPKPTWSIRSSDVPVPMNNWASTLVSNYSPPPEDSLLAQTSDITTFMDCVDDPILRHNVSKPLPLGGPPGQVTIQSDFFFNKDLEYLRYGSKGRRPALSISKMKEAYYPDAGLEQMVPDQFWIEDECKYDIAAITVRTHMRILSVIRIEVFSMYVYDYMKKIVLHRTDLNEHVIAERDFKYLYPSDFEDLNLLNLQSHLNHLPPKDKKILTTTVNQRTRQLVIQQRVEDFQHGIESYQTQVNLTKPQWTASGFEVQMMMRFNEIHKFSDGTLQQIVEALDYRVKEFRINRMNPGLNTRFWTRKDVDRCNAFMFAIQRRLRTRRIFCNLESFVGGRVREGDYKLLKRTD
nr:hypothetical protein [Tanacetum cinerariifolium]